MGNKILARLNSACIARAWALARTEHDNLLKYLRGDGPDVDWAEYPIARDYFTQRA